MSKLALKLIAEAKNKKSKKLNLGMSGLVSWPSEIYELSWLEELNVKNACFDSNKGSWMQADNGGKPNRISELPDFKKLKKLKIFRFGGDRKQGVHKWSVEKSEQLRFAHNLIELDISYCLLSRLPINALKKLKYLDCSANELKDVRLENLVNLKILECSANQLNQLNLSNLLQLESVNCSNNKLSEVNLFGLNDLRVFNCTNNNLKSLSLEGLSNLKVLECPTNKIEHLYFGGITNIETLICSSNFLKILDVQGLPMLQQLVCSTNQLVALNVEGLSKLTRLVCFNNELTSLKMDGLVNLHTFICNNNRFKELNVGSLRNLKRINCSKNPIVELKGTEHFDHSLKISASECQIEDIQNLMRWIRKFNVEIGPGQNLNLDNCPLKLPPIEIVQKGKKAVVAFFEELKLGEELNNSARLILLGNSTVGKTSLLNYLQRAEKPLSRESGLPNSFDHDSTHGMKVEIWKPSFNIQPLNSIANPISLVELEKNLTPEITVLDFGGQEYYHDCHHLFFNSNTAYVILWEQISNSGGLISTKQRIEGEVCEMDVEHFPIEYWLESISYFVFQRESANIISNIPRVLREALDETVEDVVKLESDYPSSEKIENDENLEELEKLVNGIKEEILRVGLNPKLLKSSILKLGLKEQVIDVVVDKLMYNAFNRVAVLVAQSKADLNPESFLNFKDLKEKFPFIKEVSSFSLLEERNINHLEREQLPRLLDSLNILGGPVPQIREEIISAIEPFPKISITKKEFKKLYAKFRKDKSLNGKKDDEIDSHSELCLQHFVQIGQWLKFDESQLRENDSLKDVIFVHPYQMINVFYVILDFELHSQKGIFSESIALQKVRKFKPLSSACKDDKEFGLKVNRLTKDDIREILDLMLKFKIIFQLKGLSESKERVFAVPQYLSEAPRQGRKVFSSIYKKASHTFKYHGYIHKGIVLEFFSEYGEHAEKLSEKDYLMWKNALVIHLDDQTVLVEFNTENQECYVKPSDPLKDQGLMKKIVRSFERINQGRSVKHYVSYDGENSFLVNDLMQSAENSQYKFFHQGKIIRLADFKHLLPTWVERPLKKVFLSYSHKDKEFADAFKKHCQPWIRSGIIDFWYDSEIMPGAKWDDEIKYELNAADIIVFLVSPNFMDSNYIWDIEMEIAKERSQKESCICCPLLISHCITDNFPFSDNQFLGDKDPIDHPANHQLWVKRLSELKNLID